MEAFIRYLIELRLRLLKCVIVIGVVFVIFALNANHIYSLYTIPLLKSAASKKLIALSLISPFIVPLKSAFVLAIYVTVPYWLYHLWAFITPALYRHERRFLWLILLSSTLLFYGGTLFGYFLILPLVIHCFYHMVPNGVLLQPDINHYFNFVVQLLFAFGLAFEVPVALWILVATGVTTRDALSRKRPYIIVGAFVVGMLLTPPDVISQVLLAVPLWLLYEIGLWLSYLIDVPLGEGIES